MVLLIKPLFLNTLAALLLVIFTTSIRAQEVLVLHSYHPGYRWTDDIQAGIKTVFDARAPQAELDIQYLDTKRYSDEFYYQQLLSTFRHKYRNRKFDLIISSDDNAFNFLLKYRDQLFPDVPVVFCGVNYFDPERISGLTGITGINEEANIRDGILFALRQHPKTEEVLIITDTTTTGAKVRSTLTQLLPTLPASVDYRIEDDRTLEEIIDIASNMKPNSLIYITIFIRDSIGEFYEFDQLPAQVLKKTSLPVYATWDFNLGQGVVGGLLTSGYFQGEAAAKVALRILEGEDADTIPPLLTSPNRYMFDYPVLERLGISLDTLPEDSVIINRPDSFYKKYRTQVWFALLLTFFLILLIILQRMHINRQQQTEKELKKSKQTLQGIFDNSFHFIALLDPDGVLLKTNRTSLDFAGISEQQVIGHHLWDTPLWSQSEESRQRLRNAVRRVAEGGTDRFEVVLENSQGDRVIMDFSVQPLTDDQGRVLMLVPEGRDISSLKSAEQALRDLNEQLENRVRSRTLDLERSNQDLKEILDRLTRAQKQLVESEKMAALGSLVAGVAHEINTPLGVSLTAASWLEEALNKLFHKYESHNLKRADFEHARKELHEGCAILQSNLNRSASLVKSFKMIAVDQTSEERRSFYCAEYIRSTLLALKAELRKYNHEVKTDCPEGLSINGYPGLFSQILTNLIINSLTHGFAPGQKGNIYIRLRGESDSIRLEYGDDGSGVDQQAMEQLFEPFFTTRRASGNSGLGTFIVYNICTQVLGGTLSCHSEPGQGLHYRIEIPRSAPAEVSSSLSAPLPQPAN